MIDVNTDSTKPYALSQNVQKSSHLNTQICLEKGETKSTIHLLVQRQTAMC